MAYRLPERYMSPLRRQGMSAANTEKVLRLVLPAQAKVRWTEASLLTLHHVSYRLYVHSTQSRACTQETTEQSKR